MKEKLLKFLDYIFVLRPTLFFPTWTMSLLGTIIALNSDEMNWTLIPDLSILFYLFLFTILMGALFIMNQLVDVKTDKINKKLFLIADGFISIKFAKWEMVILIILFFIGSIGNWLFMFLGFLQLLFWGIFYDYQPFNWKGKPFLGILSNMMGGLLSMLMGWSIFHSYQDISLQVFLNFLPYLLGFASVYLLTTIPDEKGDEEDNKKTMAVKHGIKKTLLFALILIVGTVLVGIWNMDFKIIVPAGLATPFFTFAYYKSSTKETLRAIRFGVFFLSMVVVVFQSWYLLLVTITFFVSKYYYKNRFNLNYPTFSVKND
ncbi:MAG: UbiA family prenyltransferase [Candidatus Marinimicrobia bacterium]|nr:UbiA family prenyltransferase [Candidatus Neomarinimicrobiota bacterium]